MNAFLVGTGLVLLIAYASTGKALKKLDIGIKSAKFIVKGLTAGKIILDLSVFNPTKKAMQFQSFFGEIFYQGDRVSYANVQKIVPIAAQDETILSGFEFPINNLTILNKLLGALLAGKFEDIKIKGEIKADGLAFPVDETVQLT
jgi:hypothetical protein